MRKNTVTSKNRSPQNLTRFPNSRPKYTQTWHHVLKRPQPCINQIKYLHSQQPFYCSSWVMIGLPKRRRGPMGPFAMKWTGFGSRPAVLRADILNDSCSPCNTVLERSDCL